MKLKLIFRYRRKARKIFERNLELSGLHLERESKMDAFDRKTSFVKIHVPKSVVDRNADILGLTAPVKEFMVTAYMSTSRNVSYQIHCDCIWIFSRLNSNFQIFSFFWEKYFRCEILNSKIFFYSLKNMVLNLGAKIQIFWFSFF